MHFKSLICKWNYLSKEDLILDDNGDIEGKENVIVANEELATDNENMLEISSTLANFFTDESL